VNVTNMLEALPAKRPIPAPGASIPAMPAAPADLARRIDPTTPLDLVLNRWVQMTPETRTRHEGGLRKLASLGIRTVGDLSDPVLMSRIREIEARVNRERKSRAKATDRGGAM
jgi:hypothetical protein